METTVKQRLIRFIKYKRLSQKKFEEAVGVSNGYVNNISKGIGADKLQRILGVYPELNQTWLLTGEGEMLNTEVQYVHPGDTTEYTRTKHGIRFLERSDGQLLMEVPLVPISALGSPADEYAAMVPDDEYETATFEVDAVHHGIYYAFRVDGDSMDDGSRRGFQKGDIVLARELERELWQGIRYRDWPYWVVVFGNNVRIKQIVAQQENGDITLHSINPSPEYQDFTLHLDDVSHIFNIVQHLPHPNTYK